jgi:hypothetical protein
MIMKIGYCTSNIYDDEGYDEEYEVNEILEYSKHFFKTVEHDKDNKCVICKVADKDIDLKEFIHVIEAVAVIDYFKLEGGKNNG